MENQPRGNKSSKRTKHRKSTGKKSPPHPKPKPKSDKSVIKVEEESPDSSSSRLPEMSLISDAINKLGNDPGVDYTVTYDGDADGEDEHEMSGNDSHTVTTDDTFNSFSSPETSEKVQSESDLVTKAKWVLRNPTEDDDEETVQNKLKILCEYRNYVSSVLFNLEHDNRELEITLHSMEQTIDDENKDMGSMMDELKKLAPDSIAAYNLQEEVNRKLTDNEELAGRSKTIMSTLTENAEIIYQNENESEDATRMIDYLYSTADSLPSKQEMDEIIASFHKRQLNNNIDLLNQRLGDVVAYIQVLQLNREDQLNKFRTHAATMENSIQTYNAEKELLWGNINNPLTTPARKTEYRDRFDLINSEIDANKRDILINNQLYQKNNEYYQNEHIRQVYIKHNLEEELAALKKNTGQPTPQRQRSKGVTQEGNLTRHLNQRRDEKMRHIDNEIKNTQDEINNIKKTIENLNKTARDEMGVLQKEREHLLSHTRGPRFDTQIEKNLKEQGAIHATESIKRQRLQERVNELHVHTQSLNHEKTRLLSSSLSSSLSPTTLDSMTSSNPSSNRVENSGYYPIGQVILGSTAALGGGIYNAQRYDKPIENDGGRNLSDDITEYMGIRQRRRDHEETSVKNIYQRSRPRLGDKIDHGTTVMLNTDEKTMVPKPPRPLVILIPILITSIALIIIQYVTRNYLVTLIIACTIIFVYLFVFLFIKLIKYI